MIIDLILVLVKGILEILLLPLTTINIAVDFVGSIPVVVEFLSIVAYVLPWTNILPILILVISISLLRIGIALIKFIWHFIPILGN